MGVDLYLILRDPECSGECNSVSCPYLIFNRSRDLIAAIVCDKSREEILERVTLFFSGKLEDYSPENYDEQVIGEMMIAVGWALLYPRDFYCAQVSI